MKFGHRGANHPVKDLRTGKIDITSQNHGYSIDCDSLKNTDLEVTHIALNDGTVEGLRHKELPAFSVQYHPEARPGPSDSNYLFDEFIAMMKDFKERSVKSMPKRDDIKTILVVGSGPIIIGQAAEFDYAGTQACLALKEEGYRVILVNSNPATIMTDKEIADKVYIEPLTHDFIARIIRKEQPDALLPTLGGQTGLNMAIQLHDSGVLEANNVKLLGTELESIQQAEDREMFRTLMNDLNVPVPESDIVNTVEQAFEFKEQVGYPLIVRPAFTMGGTGGGICHNDAELKEVVSNGLHYSPATQCLIEKSIAGYKEIEYEVMRDKMITQS